MLFHSIEMGAMATDSERLLRAVPATTVVLRLKEKSDEQTQLSLGSCCVLRFPRFRCGLQT
jgi:hypothetical protein